MSLVFTMLRNAAVSFVLIGSSVTVSFAVASTPTSSVSSASTDYTQMRSADLNDKAADADDRATFQMANRALKGLGQPADPEAAFKTFKQLADKGAVEAQLNVGRMYVQGVGTPQNIPEAKKYLETPAKSGDSRALFILANIEEQTSATLATAYSLYRMVASDNSIANAIRDVAQRKVSALTAKLSSRERDAAVYKTQQWLSIQ